MAERRPATGWRKTSRTVFGENMLSHRRRLGLHQGDLAEALGVSKSTINNWETDRVEPPAGKLSAMAKLFGVSLDALWGV